MAEEKTKEELAAELASAGKPHTGTKPELEERVADLSKEHRPDTFIARVPSTG